MSNYTSMQIVCACICLHRQYVGLCVDVFMTMQVYAYMFVSSAPTCRNHINDQHKYFYVHVISIRVTHGAHISLCVYIYILHTR